MLYDVKWETRRSFWKYTECCSGHDAVGCRCRSSHKGTGSNRLGGAGANPRDRNYSRNVWGRLWKKLHLLWKPKSTSRCEYYKAFISCSFIVFPPISGELLPSSGHGVNSLSISSILCSHNDTKSLQQSCSENCRQDGAGINLQVLPRKQSTELIQIHHLVPSKVSGSIMDFESIFMWCVNYIITIIIKYVHLWQGSDSNQSFLLQGAERTCLIWDFDCG